MSKGLASLKHASIDIGFRSVPLVEILRRAGAALGDGLRGAHLGDVGPVQCADGPVVVFALAERDPGLGGRSVLLADSRDGATLNGDQGPLPLVIPDEKRPTRWARRFTEVRISPIDRRGNRTSLGSSCAGPHRAVAARRGRYQKRRKGCP